MILHPSIFIQILFSTNSSLTLSHSRSTVDSCGHLLHTTALKTHPPAETLSITISPYHSFVHISMDCEFIPTAESSDIMASYHHRYTLFVSKLVISLPCLLQTLCYRNRPAATSLFGMNPKSLIKHIMTTLEKASDGRESFSFWCSNEILNIDNFVPFSMPLVLGPFLCVRVFLHTILMSRQNIAMS